MRSRSPGGDGGSLGRPTCSWRQRRVSSGPGWAGLEPQAAWAPRLVVVVGGGEALSAEPGTGPDAGGLLI